MLLCCRLTSNFFPWGSKYKLSDLSTYPEIKVALARAGEVARATGQRLTAHPSEFVKLAALRPELLEESLADLEQQGSVRFKEFLNCDSDRPERWGTRFLRTSIPGGDKWKQEFGSSVSKVSRD